MNDVDVNQPENNESAAAQRPARRSRRATRPAGTPERPTLDVLAELGLSSPQPEAEPAEDAGADETSEPEATQAQDAPPEATEPEPTELEDAEPDDAEAETSELETTVPETAEPGAPDAAVDDEPAGEEPSDSQADDLRLPATALLFQAPDLKPRRRRRASAPAGPPVADAAPDGEAIEPETAPEQSDAGEPAVVETPKRSRGGRGRGRRSKSADVAEPAETDALALDAVAPESAAPSASATDEAADASGAAAEEPSEVDGSAGTSVDLSAEIASLEEDAADGDESPRRRRRRGGRGRRKAKGGNDEAPSTIDEAAADDTPGVDATESDLESNDSDADSGSRRRRRRRSRGSRDEGGRARDEVTALKGSTRLEAKRQRRREGRDANRRRSIITEAEFLARRESVERTMVVRERGGRTQIAVLEDDVLVEHFVARKTQTSMVGNVYLGRVQNVLPSMEAAFIDLGRGRNAVLYAGEVNWDAAGLDGQPRRIEQALSAGDSVLVQVTKDPIGHKGARLTSQVTLAGRYLVLVPSGSMTGISRKLPDTERSRLKKLLKEIVPEGQGVIVRTAAEGASEDELRRDVERLTKAWDDIQKKSSRSSTSAPALLKGEPELATRVVRDVFNEDFRSLTVQGDEAWTTISEYVTSVAPDLAERLHHWTDKRDVFSAHRIDEQLAKGMDRKVWLPSGGSLVIDRTEAMTVVDVNTGKFTGAGGTLEETVTRNNLEAAEEIVRQLRLRDIGGIIVIDFIDMVLESNRDLVLRRLVECLGRDRTRHQVTEVTSLGLVQMTRKRVGQGLVEAFSSTCEHCHGRGFVLHDEPVEAGQTQSPSEADDDAPRSGRGGRGRRNRSAPAATAAPAAESAADPEQRAQVRATLAAIAAAAAHAHDEHPDAPAQAPEAEPTNSDEVAGSAAESDSAIEVVESEPAAVADAQ